MTWQDAAVRKSVGPQVIVVLIAIFGVVVGVGPHAAHAAPVPARLSVSPAPAIVGEQVTFVGSLPPRNRRPVLIQRRDSLDLDWTVVARGRTTASGTFSIKIAAPKRAGSATYRAFAAPVKIGRKKHPAVATPLKALATVQQRGSLSAPQQSRGNETVTVGASFYPARRGRPVTLQKLTEGAWVGVRTQVEDASGYSFWQVSSAGTYRAVAAWHKGAAEAVAGPTTVRDLPADEVWPRGVGCHKVVWVGARGSDQPQGDFNGLGAEVHGAWSHYASKLSGVDAAFYGVRYPALEAGPKLATASHREAFAKSIDAGVKDVLTFLRERPADCTDERYVLSGFSQGAMVMHRTLFALARGTNDDRSLLSRIDGVLAIADGDKVAGQGGRSYGTADPNHAYGVSWSAEWATSSGDHDAVNDVVPDLLDGPNGRYHDVCMVGDTVCDYGTAFARGDLYPVGFDIHGNAYRAGGSGHFSQSGLPHVQAAAADIARATLARLTATMPGQSATKWSTLEAGPNHSCGIKNSNGSGWCWGSNVYAELGSPAVGSFSLTAVELPGAWIALRAGNLSTCGIQNDRSLWCWGYNIHGELGMAPDQEATYRVRTPAKVGTDTDWLSVSMGPTHTCAIKTDNSAWCWGENSYGQLGNADDVTSKAQPIPRPVGAGNAWASISAGSQHTCATKVDGTAWCWGVNLYGQLGTSDGVGSEAPHSEPVQVGIEHEWAALTAGHHYTCGVTVAGEAHCWGRNLHGELGNSVGVGTIAPHPSPLRVGVESDWVSIDADVGHTCAVRQEGSAWCWGDDPDGQLGPSLEASTSTPNPNPVRVGTESNWSTIDVGGQISCGIKSDATAWCWGTNYFGQLQRELNFRSLTPNPQPVVMNAG